jgi:flagellar hook assembly protein FlgD
MPQAGPVRLDVYDAAGARVRGLEVAGFTAGSHQIRWDGRDAQGRPARPGLYWAELQVGGERRSQKIVVIE